jgi:hypothetical protein
VQSESSGVINTLDTVRIAEFSHALKICQAPGWPSGRYFTSNGIKVPPRVISIAPVGKGCCTNPKVATESHVLAVSPHDVKATGQRPYAVLAAILRGDVPAACPPAPRIN